jgi:hypothetical protein
VRPESHLLLVDELDGIPYVFDWAEGTVYKYDNKLEEVIRYESSVYDKHLYDLFFIDQSPVVIGKDRIYSRQEVFNNYYDLLTVDVSNTGIVSFNYRNSNHIPNDLVFFDEEFNFQESSGESNITHIVNGKRSLKGFYSYLSSGDAYIAYCSSNLADVYLFDRANAEVVTVELKVADLQPADQNNTETFSKLSDTGILDYDEDTGLVNILPIHKGVKLIDSHIYTTSFFGDQRKIAVLKFDMEGNLIKSFRVPIDLENTLILSSVFFFDRNNCASLAFILLEGSNDDESRTFYLYSTISGGP